MKCMEIENQVVIELRSSSTINVALYVHSYSSPFHGYEDLFVFLPASRSDATRVTMHEMHGYRKSRCNRTTK